MDRTQRLLAGLLAGQLLLIGLMQFVLPSGRAAAKEQTLLPALASMTPQRLEIDDGSGASIVIDRGDGAWTLESPKGYPAVASKVDKLIDDIEHLSAARPVVSNRRNHGALKVADDAFERRIRIWEKSGEKPAAELFVGTSPRFQISHVRVGGKDPVYEASGLNAYDLPADPGSWVDKALVPIAPDSVASIGVRNRKGSFELEKKDGRWAVRAPASRSGAALDAQKVDGLVRSLCGISLEAPAGPVGDAAYGLSAPEASVTITRVPAAPAGTIPGTGGPSAGTGVAPAPTVVSIGAPVPGKADQRYGSRSGFGFAVTLPKYSVDRALDATLAELIAK